MKTHGSSGPGALEPTGGEEGDFSIGELYVTINDE